MALKIKMNEGVKARLLAAQKRERLGAAIAAGVFIVVFGLVLAITQVFIKAPDEASFIAYQPEESDTPETRPMQSLSSKLQPSSPSVNIIVSSAVSADVTMDFDMSSDLYSTSDDLGGMGSGDGLGDGFGASSGVNLVPSKGYPVVLWGVSGT